MRFCHRRVLQQGQDGTPLPRQNVLEMAAWIQFEDAGDALPGYDLRGFFRGGTDGLHPGIFGLFLPVTQGQVRSVRPAQEGMS